MAKTFTQIKMVIFLAVSLGLMLWAEAGSENHEMRKLLWLLGAGYNCLFWLSLLELRRQD